MKSIPVASGQTGYSEQYDALRDDARGGSLLLPHQQLGVLGLPTNPGNTKIATLTINGTGVVFTFVSSIGSTPGNVLIGASAAATAANLLALLQNPQTTTSTGVALSSANQSLVVLCAYALNGTSITISSLNNSVYAPLSSFTASTNATSGTYTANTMALYIEPGTFYLGIVKVLFAGGNTATITAPITHPRIDIVTIDNTGTVAMTQGSEAVSPTAPAYPANKIVVCEIFNTVGETIIRDWNDGTQGYISNDVRPFIAPGYISDSSQVAANIFIPWIASPAQGDVPYYSGSAWSRLPAGTSGQFLQTQGAGANPIWQTATAGYHGAGTANNSNYSTASTTLVDVDATNLKVTISGLTVGQFVMIRVAGQVTTSGSTVTNGLQFNDTTNATTIFQQNITSSTGNFSFDGLYKVQSASTTFSLQYKTVTSQALVINSAPPPSWAFNGTGSVSPCFLIQALN
jgi:hypothetical protein